MGVLQHQRRASLFLSLYPQEQLNKLMATLQSTSPHFVRCIVPSEFKQSGVVDAHLIMHPAGLQWSPGGHPYLQEGLPKQAAVPRVQTEGFVDNKKASELLLRAIDLDANEYKIGHTKVFFRAGVLAKLEDMRDERLAKIMTMFQCRLRGFLMRVEFKKMLERRIGLKVIQRNTRKFLELRFWGWWKLYNKVKPLLNVARQEEEMKAKEEELRNAMAKTQELLSKFKDLEEKMATLSQEKNDLTIQLQAEQENLMDAGERLTQMMKTKMELESQISDMRERLEEEEGTSASLGATKRKLEGELSDLKRDLEGLETTLAKAEKEKQDTHAYLSFQKTLDDLQAEEDKVNHLTKNNSKLSTQIHELEDNWEQEKKIRAEVEKARRKAESDLKMTIDNLNEMERSKLDLEEAVKKKNHQRAIKSLQASLEAEAKGRAEALRLKKKMETDLNEMEIQLDHGNKNNSELVKTLRRLQQQIKAGQILQTPGPCINQTLNSPGQGCTLHSLPLRPPPPHPHPSSPLSPGQEGHSTLRPGQPLAVGEGLRPGSLVPQDLQVQMDEDARQHEQLREECSLQERRLSLLQTELDEVRSALEGSKRVRKLLEQEVAEVTERHGELSVQNQSLLVVKRKLESDVQRISNEHEELISEFRSVDERAKKAMTDISACTACRSWAGPGHPTPTPARPPASDQATPGREGHLLWFLKSQEIRA
ncbi:hypothetical protein J1605_013716 [Eschrichtius robustus]|uniref:Myosin motor domain-containing protein n=1 Tax=Eschrichtius robustus TaxID=9764 RepID=A0AB34GGZ4_ESCRO|nr:hypothetical protein J1605_013716 [Eschrichtius robustus]